MILAFCKYLETLPIDGLHLAAGESIATAKSILMEGGSDLGIRSYFGPRAEVKQFNKKDALYIKMPKTTQIIVFVGGANSDSWKSVHGMTFMSTIFTEVNILHSTFVERTVQRTLMTDPRYRKIFMDLNPMMPKHWFYTQMLDKWLAWDRNKTMLGGVNYQTVSLYDNPGITPNQMEIIKSQYDPQSNEYKSKILGLRINDLNNVYTLYDYNLVGADEIPRIEQYIIVVDIGVSMSATTFITMGIGTDRKLYILDNYYHRNGKEILKAKETIDYVHDLIDYFKKTRDTFGFAPKAIFIDRDIAFYRILHKEFLASELPHSLIKYAIKDSIEDRITSLRNLLYTNKIGVNKSLLEIKEAIQNGIYNQKELEKGKLVRLDDTTLEFNPIDILDPIEYGVSWYQRIIKY
jgi:PBSX family phage terminase large subunit